MIDWQSVSEQIESSTGREFRMTSIQPIHGGDINSAYRLQAEDTSFFVKLNRADRVSMFEAESAGLQEMAQTGALRVPAPVVCGTVADNAFLVLENIEFGRSNQAADRSLGRQLAQMHRPQQAFFGWRRDNTIGSTPQLNNQSNDWPDFWREWRLGFQLRLAADKGYRGKLQSRGDALCSKMVALFIDYKPYPSLLHGDLWGGNAAVDRDGNPVVYDPACYYGDREADLAMTELFGGFGRDFYAAYREEWPLDPGYSVRKVFYNLYHILNHLNLFGSGYLGQAENMIDQLLSELG
ncbi:MAG: fructosamine kinase family protein [Gammaproteobacteria bacterium]